MKALLKEMKSAHDEARRSKRSLVASLRKYRKPFVIRVLPVHGDRDDMSDPEHNLEIDLALYNKMESLKRETFLAENDQIRRHGGKRRLERVQPKSLDGAKEYPDLKFDGDDILSPNQSVHTQLDVRTGRIICFFIFDGRVYLIHHEKRSELARDSEADYKTVDFSSFKIACVMGAKDHYSAHMRTMRRTIHTKSLKRLTAMPAFTLSAPLAPAAKPLTGGRPSRTSSIF